MFSGDVFSTLAKYNSAIDENYLTESFVFLINSLLERERHIGVEILNSLCVQNNDFSFNMDEVISVSSQETTEQGTPDIKISSPGKLIYVEVKHDSPIGKLQLSRYERALESSSASIKHVILLTRFAIDFEKQGEKPYKHVRWFEVYNWLANVNPSVKEPVIVYLIDSFKSFLEVKQMSIQKVGWEYINGVPALINLVNMIEVAIQGASLDVYSRSAQWEQKGFYVEDNKLWCGIHYNNPLVITFEMIGKEKFDLKAAKKTDYALKEGRERIWFRLPLEDLQFFSLDKDEQLEKIIKFIKVAYAEAQRMRLKGE